MDLENKKKMAFELIHRNFYYLLLDYPLVLQF